MSSQGLTRILEVGAGIALASVTTVVFVSVVARALFGVAVPDSFDFTRLLLGMTIFWGIAAALATDSHLKVDLLWDRMSAKVQRFFRLFDVAGSLIIFGLLTWQFGLAVLDAAKSNILTADLRLPIWYFYAFSFVALPTGVAVYLRRLCGREFFLRDVHHAPNDVGAK